MLGVGDPAQDGGANAEDHDSVSELHDRYGLALINDCGRAGRWEGTKLRGGGGFRDRGEREGGKVNHLTRGLLDVKSERTCPYKARLLRTRQGREVETSPDALA